MNLLHKAFPLEIKAVDEAGIVEGYASVFGGPPDAYGDIIAPGAFADSLATHRRSGTTPLFLWGHDASNPPIGNWLDLAEDGKGLWVKGQLDLEDSMGARVHRALSRKSMRGLSIGYETKQADTDPKRPGVRTLKAVDLWEISPVNFPAQPRAAVENVKAFTAAGQLPSMKEFEAFLREAGGLSKRDATFVVNHGFAQLARSESGQDQAAATDFWAALRG